MTRRSRTTIALMAGVALLATGITVATAQGGGGRRGPGGPGGPGGFGRGGGPGLALRALDLTDAQKEQVQGVMERYREEMQQAGTKLREAHDAQRKAVEAVPMDEGLIRSASQALANAQTDMAILQARVHNEVWAFLTAEQQTKAKELSAQRGERMKERTRRGPRQ